MISFSGETQRGPFWKLIQSGEKKQTIRLPRVRPIKPGDKLTLYWKVRVPREKKPIHYIGAYTCIEVVRTTLFQMWDDEENAIADGFKDLEEFREWFEGPEPLREYDIIKWGKSK